MLKLDYINRFLSGTLLVVVFLVGCSNSDSNNPAVTPAATSDIVDTAIAHGNFTQLVAALQAAGLVDALRGPGPFKVFAPTDTAFGKIPAATIAALLADIPTLQNILTYHAVGSELFAVGAIAASGTTVTTLNTTDVAVDLVGSDLYLNFGGSSPAIVTVTDFISTNGVIHMIDTVLDPNDAP